MKVLESYKNPAEMQLNESARLAALLGLSQPGTMNDLKLAERVARGLPLAAVNRLAPLIDRAIPGGFYKLVSESTLRRAKARKRLTREPSERVYELSRVIDQAAIIYHGDAAAVGRFLTRPHQLLNGKTPFEVASASSAGTHTVVKLLRQADAGVAV